MFAVQALFWDLRSGIVQLRGFKYTTPSIVAAEEVS